MSSNKTKRINRGLLSLAVLLAFTGGANAKPHECAKTCEKDGECETCKITLCEKRKQKDGSMGDVIVAWKTVTSCPVDEGTAVMPTAGLYQREQAELDAGKTGGWNRAAAVVGQQASAPAQVSRPTVDGRLKAPPPGYEVAVAAVDRWNVRPGAFSVPRRFDSFEAFAEFAEENLNATAYRDASGNLVAVGGRYQWSAGDVQARRDNPDALPDIVSRELGGTERRLIIGDRQISFAPDGNGTTAFSPFSTTEENCVGRHCIEGKSWIVHLIYYHSVGTRTRQTAGGTDLVPRPCCSSGELVQEGGNWMCRGRRPGAWEYDREAGRLVPTGLDPYVMTEARTCQRESLRNQLQVRGAFVDRNNVRPTIVSNIQSNTREVEIGEWLISLGLDTSSYEISDIGGICSIHASNRGESVRTIEGYAGDDGSLCP